MEDVRVRSYPTRPTHKHPAQARRPARRRSEDRIRSQAGIYLLELLIAVATCAMLGAALAGTTAETMRLASAGQNQILATNIAQLIVDNVRGKPFDEVVPGTYVWHVPAEAGDSGAAFISRELQDAPAHFEGDVVMTVTPGAGVFSSTRQVDVVVSWTEGQAPRQFHMTTRISQNGIHI